MKGSKQHQLRTSLDKDKLKDEATLRMCKIRETGDQGWHICVMETLQLETSPLILCLPLPEVKKQNIVLKKGVWSMEDIMNTDIGDIMSLQQS